MARAFTPKIEVTVDGKPVAGIFYSLLVKATLRDEAGKTADSLTLTFDDARNQIAPIRKGAEIAVRLGYLETGLFDKGLFKVEKAPLRGSVSKGEFLEVTAKAADMTKEVKGEGRKAYFNKTLGQIIEAEAKAAGFEALVDPELAGIQLPYRLRFDQSRIDFITGLAAEAGGTAKPAGGKIIVQKRGGGTSGSGLALAPIRIDKRDCSEWIIDPDGRLQYGEVEAFFVDPKTGKRQTVKEKTGLDGPAFTLREPFSDEKRARRAAKAETGRLNQGTGNGTFTMAGRPEAQAGAPAILTGFRPDANGEWRADVVEHNIEPGSSGGFTTTVEVKPKEDGKTKSE
jgi:phage protein D